jgi:hypothetical protein
VSAAPSSAGSSGRGPDSPGQRSSEMQECFRILLVDFLACLGVDLRLLRDPLRKIAGKGKQGMRLGSGVNIASVTSIAL